jgi:ATP-dependent phosphoenolpyruvate carboxykinase
LKRTLGELADSLHAKREEKRAAEEVVKALDEEYRRLEAELMELADEQQTLTGKGKTGSFSVVEKVLPQVKDWDAFYKYIQKTKYWHLLERRPSVTGCRELFDTKGAIPGVEKFTKRSINLRGV